MAEWSWQRRRVAVRRAALDVLHDGMGVPRVLRGGEARALVAGGDRELAGVVGRVLPHRDLDARAAEALGVDVVGIGDADRVHQVVDALALVQEDAGDGAVAGQRRDLGGSERRIDDRRHRIGGQPLDLPAAAFGEGGDGAADLALAAGHGARRRLRLAALLLVAGGDGLAGLQPDGHRHPGARATLLQMGVQALVHLAEAAGARRLQPREQAPAVDAAARLVEGQRHRRAGPAVGRLHELDEAAARAGVDRQARRLGRVEAQAQHALDAQPRRHPGAGVGDEEGNLAVGRQAAAAFRHQAAHDQAVLPGRQAFRLGLPVRDAAAAAERDPAALAAHDDAALRRFGIERARRLDGDGGAGKEDLVGNDAHLESAAGCHGRISCSAKDGGGSGAPLTRSRRSPPASPSFNRERDRQERRRHPTRAPRCVCARAHVAAGAPAPTQLGHNSPVRRCERNRRARGRCRRAA